ncbi:lipase 3-like [Cylas formicarius]|uniref:lipase 3-like n=1 Tax=Cylas formicarius TaxID=197179 RepID=UPI00295857C0|nr:lipase 3-like [Cylas formicarius]XP_060520950.1 lipase 3-like [Cylas formicarius]XP_060520951.1 lipase 3-like [Cylas formicarius]
MTMTSQYNLLVFGILLPGFIAGQIINLEQRLKHAGYPLETHTVVTKDGYILSLYRVSDSPNLLPSVEHQIGNKSVVLLVHGMGGTPELFFILGRDSLGYYMADRGFEVWILCTRGISCSSEQLHKRYDWDRDKKYWDFSFHDIATRDLPAHIDYVLNRTSQSSLFLIGHSAGNTVIFAMAAELPEYNRKVKIAAAYAMTVILRGYDYPLMIFTASAVKVLKGLYRILGIVEFMPYVQYLRPFLSIVCSHPEYRKMCIGGVSIVGSQKSMLMDFEATLPLVISHSGLRLASKQIFHYLELIEAGAFKKYDYGPKKNSKIYGQTDPPHYNLSRVTMAVASFRAASDSICTKQDVQDAMDRMPNVIFDYVVPYERFTHTDFIFTSNASRLVYEPTYRLFKDFDEGKVPPRRKQRN